VAFSAHGAWSGPVPTTAYTPTPSATPTITLTPSPTATNTEAPTSTATPTATSDLPDWHKYVNYHRALADLPPITENEDYSHGCELHSKYMVKNDAIGHSESPTNPHYTEEGAAAASGNVYGCYGCVPGETVSPEDAIDAWMTGPFHMLQIINPRYEVGGYGDYYEKIGSRVHFAATLDVNRGRGDLPSGLEFPVYYPERGRHIPNLSYNGNEFPDPLIPCPGYKAAPPSRTRTGPPIALQLGTGAVTPELGTTSFRQGNQELDHCAYDETIYPSGVGQLILDLRDAVILMPRSPLTAGEEYTVSIEVSGSTYTWSFTAGAPSRSAGHDLLDGFVPLLVPPVP
jgi:uncharacterized protein YkwD